MSAIHILQFPVAADTSDDHGRVFFSDMLMGKESVDGGHNLRQRHAGSELRKNHALKSRSQQGGRNALAADSGQYYGESVFGIDRIVEVASDLLTGKISAAQPRERNFRNGHCHQPLLDGRRDSQLLLVTASGLFGLYKARVLH